jgi:hypothetical protein
MANRALAWASCNLAKTARVNAQDPLSGSEVELFNPRTEVWEDHFRWREDQATLEGHSATGRATIAALDMNSELRKEARRLWFQMGLLP